MKCRSSIPIPGLWIRYAAISPSAGRTSLPARVSPSRAIPNCSTRYWAIISPAAPLGRYSGWYACSKDRNSVDKLNVGSMAKYTLSMYAMRDPGLLELLKSELSHQSKETVAILNEVIEAADTADVGRIRKEALAAVEELKRKGPGYKRDISFWGQVGEGAVSLGCVAAAALGQIEFGIPCVLGGAATS